MPGYAPPYGHACHIDISRAFQCANSIKTIYSNLYIHVIVISNGQKSIFAIYLGPPGYNKALVSFTNEGNWLYEENKRQIIISQRETTRSNLVWGLSLVDPLWFSLVWLVTCGLATSPVGDPKMYSSWQYNQAKFHMPLSSGWNTGYTIPYSKRVACGYHHLSFQ